MGYMVYASLHERGFLYMHAPHQHANSTPPFRKVWLRAWCTNDLYLSYLHVNRPNLGGTVPLLLPLSHRPTFTPFRLTFLNPLQLTTK